MDKIAKICVVKAVSYDQIKEILMNEDDPAKAAILALTAVLATDIKLQEINKEGG